MPDIEDEFEDDRPRRRKPPIDDQEDDYDDDRGHSEYLKPHRGPMVLVFGILGMMFCGALGIVAFLMGRKDLKEINEGRMDPEGKSLTQVGHILGIVGIVLFCIQLTFVVLYLGFIIIMVATRR